VFSPQVAGLIHTVVGIGGKLGPLVLEAVGIGQECGIKGGLADDPQVAGHAVVDAVRGRVADAAMAVLGVVPARQWVRASSMLPKR
jgi:2C-methyl-D-erythritol 2,4-cyclodiphosphate synthase